MFHVKHYQPATQGRFTMSNLILSLLVAAVIAGQTPKAEALNEYVGNAKGKAKAAKMAEFETALTAKMAETPAKPKRKPRRTKVVDTPPTVLETIGAKVGKIPSDLGFAGKMAIKRSQFKSFMADWSLKAGYKKQPGNDTDFNLAVATEGREGSKGAKQLYHVLSHHLRTGQLLHIDDLAKIVGQNVNETHYDKARKFLASSFNK